MTTQTASAKTVQAKSPQSPILLREAVGSIAVLTLNRPAARNSLSEGLIAELHAALRRYGATTLLYVRLADAENPFPSVVWKAPGLMIGYIDRFSYQPDGTPVGRAHDSWAALRPRCSA